MDDTHYPTIDFDFLKMLLDSCGNIQKKVAVGSTTAYLFKGESSISKRTLIIRTPEDNKIDFNFAVALAHKAKKLGELLIWLEKERNWKDGAYIVETKNHN